MLAEHNSLALADARYIYDEGAAYGVDPAMLLVIICRESTCASRGRVTRYCYNAGNVKWRQGEPRCPYADGSYRSYTSWRAATDDWYYRIRKYYIDEGIVTLPAMVGKYYPPIAGNDTALYTRQVEGWLALWRREGEASK